MWFLRRCGRRTAEYPGLFSSCNSIKGIVMKLTSLALSAALVMAPLSAMAADNQSDLAPGPAAGVQKAQMWMTTPTGMYITIAVVTAGLIVIASSNSGG